MPKVVVNRECARDGCEKRDLAASRIEAEYHHRQAVRRRLDPE